MNLKETKEFMEKYNKSEESKIYKNMYLLTGFIYNIMERDDITIYELSRRTNISVTRLTRILSGDSNCRIHSIFKILMRLETPITIKLKFNV